MGHPLTSHTPPSRTALTRLCRRRSSQRRPRSPYTENVVPSLTITRNVGFASLVSLTSYQRTTANIVVGTDAVPIVVSKGNVTQSVTAVTQELQLVSPLDSPVKWIVGAFYMHRNGDYDPIEITSRFADIKIYGEQTTSSVASFGQLTVPITKTNNITAGVRYNMDSQRANTLAHVNGFQVGNTSYANEDFDSLSFRLSGRAVPCTAAPTPQA